MLQAVRDCASIEDIQAIARKFIERAKEGNVQAGKLIFSYILGKPRETVDPDQLNTQEWELSKQAAKMTEEVVEVAKNSLEPDMVINMSRALRPVMADVKRPNLIDRILCERDLAPETHGHYFHLACPDIDYDDYWPVRMANNGSGRPSPNGQSAATGPEPPSPNGNSR
jgi:hypothetical protein